ncbi:MAG: hypothetical protein ABR886_08750 [Dehalococcoidales bacterium]|jgi:hypothetical protein
MDIIPMGKRRVEVTKNMRSDVTPCLFGSAGEQGVTAGRMNFNGPGVRLLRVNDTGYTFFKPKMIKEYLRFCR